MTDRKVLIAYYCPEDVFVIPKGLDLEDKTVVDEYWVKRGILYIAFVDKTKPILEIDSQRDTSEDMKYPTETKIDDADDWGIEIDEEEEEEEEEKYITGIICNKCKNILPPHTQSQHLDVNNPIHECPHRCEEEYEIEVKPKQKKHPEIIFREYLKELGFNA